MKPAQLLGQVALSVIFSLTGMTDAMAQRGGSPPPAPARMAPAPAPALPRVAPAQAAKPANDTTPVRSSSATTPDLLSPLAAGAAVMIVGTSAANSVSAQEHLSPSARKLGQRINIADNLPTIASCFHALGIEEKPLPKMLATDAAKVVACADQKGIDQFLSDPVSGTNRKIASNIVRENMLYFSTSAELKGDSDFSMRVATTCKQQGKVTLGSFEQCAGDVYDQARSESINKTINKGLGIVFGGAALLLVAGGAGYGIYSYSKYKNNGPSAHIS